MTINDVDGLVEREGDFMNFKMQKLVKYKSKRKR